MEVGRLTNNEKQKACFIILIRRNDFKKDTFITVIINHCNACNGYEGICYV